MLIYSLKFWSSVFRVEIFVTLTNMQWLSPLTHWALHMEHIPLNKRYNILMSLFPCAGDIWFSLNGTTYHNNSIVFLEDIGERDNALDCISNLTTCYNQTCKRNWFFPNETRVLSRVEKWDFYRTRGQMVVRLNRRRGGEEGIYHCEILDSVNVTHTIYIGVYTSNTSTGELQCL